MSHEQLIQLRDEVCKALMADGWDYDDARFATMTAGASGAGILGEQPQGASHPELERLAAAAQGVERPAVANLPGSRELPDHDADTAVDGIE